MGANAFHFAENEVEITSYLIIQAFGYYKKRASPDIPVTGVHWAVEMTGKDTALWFSVHGMRTC